MKIQHQQFQGMNWWCPSVCLSICLSTFNIWLNIKKTVRGISFQFYTHRPVSNGVLFGDLEIWPWLPQHDKFPNIDLFCTSIHFIRAIGLVCPGVLVELYQFMLFIGIQHAATYLLETCSSYMRNRQNN